MPEWPWTPDETGLEAGSRPPWLATDLLAVARRCPCDAHTHLLCARCDCALRVVEALEVWLQGKAHGAAPAREAPCSP